MAGWRGLMIAMIGGSGCCWERQCGLSTGMFGRPVPSQVGLQLFGRNQQVGLAFADEPETTFTLFIVEAAGHGEYFLFTFDGSIDGKEAAACDAGFYHDQGIAQSGDEFVAQGESIFFGFDFMVEGGEQPSLVTYGPGQSPVFGGIDHIEAVSQYTNGGDMVMEGGMMGCRVDA